MKNRQTIFILFLLVALVSCGGKSKDSESPETVGILAPNVDVKELQSDFMKWWTYHSRSISLSSDFVGFDEHSDTIGKKGFLEKLGTGKYIPLKLASDKGRDTYQLYRLDWFAHEGIGPTIENESKTNLNYFTMEGAPFPEFDFTDLVGNHYTSQNTQGKTLVLKTWFIACKPCLEEIPKLNELVGKYSNQDDLMFISLALDSQAELEKFLKKKNFDYQVVASQEELIKEKLELQLYPTHLIVDQNGSISKVFNKASDMILFLEDQIKLAEKNPSFTSAR
ncbi:TlpA family protein disulfide reductase [Algoriphagus aestuariicola]|uniref:TlpA family protein disulfide reductase n=1 Tax=Algoriphagus aestuariicola TaxID=1852016 RepID=A0ABS3BMT7_9BACT|nr:TlpA disulfide reductase family protein [Algoriphagus aestuariicola]MBN7799650.1 TlpA family protein disulfide reductase [Algoriphagus aestuariicola]